MRLQTPAQFFAPRAGQVRFRDFLREVPRGAAQVASEPPRDLAKLAISVGELPFNFKNGRPTNLTYPGGIQSVQTEAARTNEDIIAGRQPMRNAFKPFLEVPMMAGEMMGFTRPAIRPIKRAVQKELWNMSDDAHFFRNPIQKQKEWVGYEPVEGQFSFGGQQVRQQLAQPRFRDLKNPGFMPFNPQSKIFKLLELLLGNK